jgi:starch synthase (maltosyl-transferring)
MAYSKSTPDFSDVVLVVVDLDPHNRQVGTVHLDIGALGLDHDAVYEVHDLLGDGRYRWQGAHNYIELDPWVLPAHVFEVIRLDRTERDFVTYA